MPGLLIIVQLGVAAASARETVHNKAMQAFWEGEFKRAVAGFEREISLLAPDEQGSTIEQKAREYLVLSLFHAGKKNEAADACQQLKARFAWHEFNKNELLPSTIRFFDKRCPKPALVQKDIAATAVVPTAPTAESHASLDEPRELRTPPKTWSPAFLLPLGIGQFIAGSPGRGVLFLVVELALLGVNLTGVALYYRQLQPSGYFRDPQIAANGQIMMNVGLFGLGAALIAGLIDGAAFEP
jgi:hypothetical protein